MDNRPIGVFDSGFGGLTVLRCLKQQLPSESLIYLGDGVNCPYGEKTQAEVVKYSVDAVDILLREGVKMVVVACNTATAYAIEVLRSKYGNIPFVGIEPAVKPAVTSTKSGVIGVLATDATIHGDMLKRLVDKYGDRAEILMSVGDGFVELVEGDKELTQEAKGQVAKVIEPLLDRGVDMLVLGCTHYPLLESAIRSVVGEREVELIDPAPAIVRRVEQLLDQYDIKSDTNNCSDCRIMTLADDAYLCKLKAKCGQLM